MDFDFSLFEEDENSKQLENQPTSFQYKRSLEDGDQNLIAKKRKEIELNKNISSSNIKVTEENSITVEKDFKAAGTLGSAEVDNQAQLKIVHNVKHQVALPDGYPYIPISQHKRPDKPAREYPFKLDAFQETAICSIERNESVLVSAHTSAGKTVVAEYAIALSLKNKQRVIYTSPIKALSNQKYREMLEDFGDVGLMTGDVSINPNASLLIMTTEILRSMLYRGSEVIREVAWIIFDEIHYMRDKARGVVWEETIILLPDNVRFVFLSATIPNAMQFAQWIVKLHKTPCHVVYTDYRPTPLQHYLHAKGNNGIHLCVDEKGVFREENFQKAIGSLQDNQDQERGRAKKRNWKDRSGAGGGTKEQTDLYKIIRMIMVKNYHPVIVFSFAKRECESNALQVSKLDFNDEKEKEMVASVFNNAILSLSEEDRSLPQIEHLLPLLKRGIGIHHSGLLPILKEVIEILFQEGLIKVLFATETFSIGLNMPAKTVVFTNVRKWDGKETRWLGSGEYIQMSGRAGRRGLDDRGIVILMLDEKMEPAVAKGMLKGEADRLDSAFYLTYSMILNMIRVEGAFPEMILEQSFFQYQTCSKIPELERELSILEDRKEKLMIDDEDQVARYYDLKQQLNQYVRDFRDVITNPNFCLPFLQPGRLFKIVVDSPKEELSENRVDFGWGILVNYQKRLPHVKGQDFSTAAEGPTFILDVLLYCTVDGEKPRPCVEGEVGEMVVVPCSLSSIDAISTIKINLAHDVKSAATRNNMFKTLKEIKRRFGNNLIPRLDPVNDMGIKDEGFVKLVKKIQILESKIYTHPLRDNPRINELYEQFLSKQILLGKIRALKKQITATQSIVQMDELKCRRRVLRRMGYINEQDVIEMKGRVACEISSGGFELLLTEMMFQGVFNELSAEQCAALLSCFTFTEKTDVSEDRLKQELSVPLKVLHEQARRIVKVSIESKLQIDEEEFLQSLRHELMDIVFAWCQGASFAQICKMTSIYEGSIIRSIRNLEELLRQMCNAAKAIGNDMLEAKFLE
ncbi:ATP-dependent RNA helicase mtr4, partial [Clydaea vesicula]